MNGWLTPDSLPSGFRSCVLTFPDSEEWAAIVRGCIFLLSEEQNFEEFGSLTVAEVADTFRQTLFDFLEDDCVIVPVGAMLEFGGDVLPDGFLWCDGAAISRTIYADLFGVIDVNYGAGNGTTTFNVPDRRGRVAVGLDPADGDFDLLGATGGSKTVTLTVAEMPPHKHDTRIVAGGTTQRFATNATGNNTFTASQDMANTGGGEAHDNMPPYLIVNYIIRYR